ncbi:MAG: CBS domain-containing protein [Bacteroidales bacterium]|nr:CBS domain-containing protein [Bacteroidales bacterium]
MPLHPDDEGSTALVWMDELKVFQLPVVTDGKFTGLINEKDILSLRDVHRKIRDMKLPLQRFFAFDHQHMIEVIKILAVNNLTLLPVIDEKEQYIGSVTSHDLLSGMARISAIDNPGAIIVVEVGKMDYVLSEISRIVESNDAKILCMYVTTPDESTRIEVTLKINKRDIQHVLQTFNRYNYIVKASFSEDRDYFDDLKERYDSFMKYLNT